MHVFIIATSHNMIQVKEAIKYYGIDKRDLLIIYMHFSGEQVPMNIIPEDLNWQHFNIWSSKDVLIKRHDLHKYSSFLKQLKKRHDSFVVYSNFYTSDYVLVANSILKPQKIVIMDEGTAMVRYVMIRNSAKNGAFKYLIKSLIYFRRINLPNKVCFFTQYPFDIKAPDTIDIYEFDKEQNKITIDQHYAIILGQPLSEEHIITLNTYMDLMLKLNVIFQNNGIKNIEYYAHRREDFSKLEQLKSYGWNVFSNKKPFEVLFPTLEPCPGQIYGFYSPILDTISKKYENIPNFYFIVLPKESYLDDSFIVCNTIYNLFAKNPRLKAITLK